MKSDTGTITTAKWSSQVHYLILTYTVQGHLCLCCKFWGIPRIRVSWTEGSEGHHYISFTIILYVIILLFTYSALNFSISKFEETDRC